MNEQLLVLFQVCNTHNVESIIFVLKKWH